MRFEEIIKVLHPLTCVEIVKTGDRTIYKGKLKDVSLLEMADYHVYGVIPCSSSRETYLELDVY